MFCLWTLLNQFILAVVLILRSLHVIALWHRYQKLGLALEEVVEVSMKLNTLKTLGINLQIEDLFDEEGFSLANVNNTLLGDSGQWRVGSEELTHNWDSSCLTEISPCFNIQRLQPFQPGVCSAAICVVLHV